MDLSRNQIAAFKIGLSDLKNLQDLNLKGNLIAEISDDFFSQVPNLVTLNLNQNGITGIQPLAFKGLDNLQNLTLSSNKLSSIHYGSFEPLKKLVKLHLDSNILESLPEGISHLKSLQFLDLGENKIEVIPEGLLQNCPNLRLLELKANPLSTIHPDAFIFLPSLEKLAISEAKDIKQFPNLNGTHSLKSIKFDRSKIAYVPQDICLHAMNLKSLELKSNELEVMPSLKGCYNLRVM